MTLMCRPPFLLLQLTLDADDYDESATWWGDRLPVSSAIEEGQAANLIIGNFSHDIDIRYSITGGWGFLDGR